MSDLTPEDREALAGVVSAFDLPAVEAVVARIRNEAVAAATTAEREAISQAISDSWAGWYGAGYLPDGDAFRALVSASLIAKDAHHPARHAVPSGLATTWPCCGGRVVHQSDCVWPNPPQGDLRAVLPDRVDRKDGGEGE